MVAGQNRAFSLIELMIVIAIIAFLSMISIPSLMKFLAKAKRTEAYVYLNSLATAEKTYFAEFGKYTDDLNKLGWKPEGVLNYTYGFPGAQGKNYISGELPAGTQYLSGARASSDGFVIYAVGDISGNGKPDILSVDQSGKIKLVQDALAS